ncbi:hypothetical protein A4X06_0g3539 [Tilletia controversa]|uniref:Uncharacterized protein n=1 Tax=Tilletia controversa TaxID=13291 RepID=A0A8X7MUC0_9BASI|nr:hypothetical protein A4X06_0g3539 [Tilletia controversa]
MVDQACLHLTTLPRQYNPRRRSTPPPSPSRNSTALWTTAAAPMAPLRPQPRTPPLNAPPPPDTAPLHHQTRVPPLIALRMPGTERWPTLGRAAWVAGLSQL